MTQCSRRWDAWTLPNLAAWTLFFSVGLDPETVFARFRVWGGVLTQDAWVNSPHMITLGLAAYVGVFAYQRCIESGLDANEAQGRGVQTAVLGLAAFLKHSPLLLVLARNIPDGRYRMIVYTVMGAKLLAWLYLYSLFLRYYVGGSKHVFASMTTFFPSAHYQDGLNNDPVPDTPVSDDTAWRGLDAGSCSPPPLLPPQPDEETPSQKTGNQAG